MEATIKGQSSLEYIVLLSAVIILVGAVIAIFFSSSQQSNEVGEITQDLSTSGLEIGLTDVAVSIQGIELTLVNNMGKHILINEIYADGEKLNSTQLPLRLFPNQRGDVQSYAILREPGESYAYDIAINYTEVDLDLNRTLSGSDYVIKGVTDRKSIIFDLDESIMSDIVSYWKFDSNDWESETYGVNDLVYRTDQGNARTGTTRNTTDAVSGFAATFDGEDGSIQIGADNDPMPVANNSYYTIAAWFKLFQTQAGNQGIYGFYSSTTAAYWSFAMVVNNGNLRAIIGNGTNIRNRVIGVPSLNAWHHGVATFNGTHHAIYFDAVLTESISMTSWGAGSNIPGYPSAGVIHELIGSSYTENPGNQHQLNGTIDEVMLWNRSLSAEEVGILFRRGNYSLTGVLN